MRPWPFSSIVFSSGGQPSECRPFLVLLDFIFSYPVSSTDSRARCCLTFSFDCLLFRRSPIRVPSWPGAAGLHLRLSRFPVVTHPTADRAWCCLTFFFYCLLYRWSPIWVPAFPGASGLHVRPSRFRRSPIPLPTEPGACLTFFFECLLTPLQVVAHPSADLARFPWTSSSAVPFSGGHSFHCPSSSVLLYRFL